MSIITLSSQLGRRATVADGAVVVRKGASTSLRVTEIIITVYDADGDQVTTATGTISGESQASTSDRWEAFPTTPTINLATDASWVWSAESSTKRAFRFTAAGLPADHTFDIAVSSWGSI